MSPAPPAIRLERVSKRFKRYRTVVPSTSIKASFFDWLRGRSSAPAGPAEFEAIRDATFDVERGETFGVIGRNGAGKSTLLKLVARIFKPDSGTVTVSGRVAALIELGAGFHPEFTGAENIIMNGMMLGLSRAAVKERFAEIVAFADLGDFIGAPIRTYSSGMYLRLAFSVAIHVDPDVLLVDEILAVGDETFRGKCHAAIAARVASRRQTTVIVSHDLDQIARLCQRAALVDPSGVRVFASPREAIDAYHELLYRGGAPPAAPPPDPAAEVEALRGDLDEIARALEIPPGEAPPPEGPGRTPTGRAILAALAATRRARP